MADAAPPRAPFSAPQSRAAFAWTALILSAALLIWNGLALLTLWSLVPTLPLWIALCIGAAPTAVLATLVAGFFLGLNAQQRS